VTAYLIQGKKLILVEKKPLDNRPKLVIFGLTFEEANKHFSQLKESGIIEIIDLENKSLFNFKTTRIVKVVMKDEETAT